jgi:hypothetical protein
MAPLPDTHPDGDPFAEQDRAKEGNTLIGRMEQRALLEANSATTPATPSTGFAPPKPRSSSATTKNRASLSNNTPSTAATRPQPPSSSTSNPNGNASLGTGREIVIEDSDSDSEGEAVMTGDEGAGQGEGQGGEGSDDDEDEGEDGSGTEGEGSEGEGTPVGPQDEEDDEDDSEDDSEDDDDESTASGPTAAKGGEDGEGDVSMADSTTGGEARPKSPVKPSSSTAANGEAKENGDISMTDGSPAVAGEGADTAEKPKKPRARRRAPRSPTPPPPAPKPPAPTIRLEFYVTPRNVIQTGGPPYPEYNVIEEARKKGFVPPVEEKKAQPEEDSASEAEGKTDKGKGKAEGEGEGAEPPVRFFRSFFSLLPFLTFSRPIPVKQKKKRKRGPNVIVGRHGGYDTADPFVDDDEIELYEVRLFLLSPPRFLLMGLLPLRSLATTLLPLAKGTLSATVRSKSLRGRGG